MPRKYTPEERIAAFWSKVDKSGGPDACWEWTGSINQSGYGNLQIATPAGQLAHRISFELAHGPFPVDLHVLHTCDNRRCVNPAHLYLGTEADNARDRVQRGRSNGHLRAGSRNGKSRLTLEQALEICRLYAETDLFQWEIAEQFGISQVQVDDIVSGISWSHDIDLTRFDFAEANQTRESRRVMARSGENSSRAKLTDAQIVAIREQYANGGVSQTALAHKFGVHQSHISSIVRGRTRKQTTA